MNRGLIQIQGIVFSEERDRILNDNFSIGAHKELLDHLKLLKNNGLLTKPNMNGLIIYAED